VIYMVFECSKLFAISLDIVIRRTTYRI